MPHSRGFTFAEMLVTVAVIGVLGAITGMGFNNLLPRVKADAALSTLETVLANARELAVDQRRMMRVSFVGRNEIQIFREEQPTGETQLSDTLLPYTAAFILFPGLPDTPEGFGNSYAIEFAGVATSILYFQSDGSVVDVNGQWMNGSLFLGLAGRPDTARAVTLMGATGGLRAYRYDGTVFTH